MNRPGPKLEDGKHRVRLCGYGPKVARLTDDTLKTWRGAYNIPLGRIIDSLLVRALEDPDFYLEAKQ